MTVSDLKTSFSAGEISPELYGEVDLKKFSSAATTLRNAFVNYRGGALSRGGLAFVGRCKQTTNPIGGANASGSILFNSNLSVGDTITLNGVVWTFVASGGGGTNIRIGGTTAVTLGNFRIALNASTNPLIDVATYATSGGPTVVTMTISYDVAGTAGNAYTISSTSGTPSGPTLTGGINPIPFGPPRPITFTFNNNQSYCLEFGQNYLRFVFQGGYITEAPVSISSASQSNPCSIGVSGIPFLNGDWVFGAGIGGMTQLNGNTYIVANAAVGSFTLEDLNGNAVDSTLYTAYTSGGTFSRIYELSTPYSVQDLPYLKFTQSADVMVLTCSNPNNADQVPGEPATGFIFFTVNPSNGDSVAMNGITYTFVTSGATGNQINIGGTTAFTIASLVSVLNASTNPALNVASYATAGGPTDVSLNVTYKAIGTIGNSYNLAASAATISGATLTGGTNAVIPGEYPSYKLTRLSATNWTLVPSNFDPVIGAPTGITASSNADAPTSGINATFDYVVTAVDGDGNESIASAIASCNGADIQVEGGTNVIKWSGVQNAKYYNIYRTAPSVDGSGGPIAVPDGSIFGFVGSSNGTAFNDTIPTADVSQTPPIHSNPFAPGPILGVTITSASTGLSGVGYSISSLTGSNFAGSPLVISGSLGGFYIQNHGEDFEAGDTITFTTGSGTAPTGTLAIGPETGTYPGVCAYFQQRLIFANSLNNPDTFWASQVGLYSNFDTSVPAISTDSIVASPWTEQVNGIQWLIPMPGGLIAMTGLRAWQLNGVGGSGLNPQPITPSDTQAQPQAFNGCSATIPPVVENYDVIYVQAVGDSTVYDLSWNFWVNIYTGNDLTILSSHLFIGRQIVQWAWCRQPYKVLWASCDDGTMLSLTYLKDQEIYGWARHDTLGFVAGVTSVSEPPVNALYAVVQRASPFFEFGIYCMERMDDRIWESVEDAYAVDSAVSNPMSFPNASLRANTVTGSTTFLASAQVFSSSTVGQVLRMAGGIAEITGYTDQMTITGTWVKTPSAGTVVFGIFGAPYAAAGNWSLATPVTSLSAPHLFGTGHELVGLADGVPISNLTADDSGVIPLPFPASDVKVGLPFVVQVQTAYLNGQNAVQGARKVIPAATVRVSASGSFQIGTNQPDGAAQNPPQLGPAWTNMAAGNFSKPTGGQSAPQQYTSPGGQAVTQLFTGDLRVVGGGAAWNSKGQVAVQQLLPLPLEIVAIMPEVLPGDIAEVTYRQEAPQRQIPRGPGPWRIGAG